MQTNLIACICFNSGELNHVGGRHRTHRRRFSTSTFSWSCIHPADCIFTEGIYFEDTEWTPRMLCKAQRVTSTDTMVYNYLVRIGSITKAINKTKLRKVLDDKMRLIEAMQKQSKDLQTKGWDNRWYARMIADTVVSIITILGTQFYSERKEYLEKLRDMKIYPIHSSHIKSRLINFSPRFAVALLHLKNS